MGHSGASHLSCPGSTCPGTGRRTLQTPGSSCLSDHGGSIPVSTAWVCPNTLGTGIHWKGHTAHPQGFCRALSGGSSMVLQSTFPLAHVAFGNNWKSPDTFTEPLCLSPCLGAVLTGRCCMSAPHPKPLPSAPVLMGRPGIP